ncbi:unnamed protein product [Symbiodinium natans]|uniref:Uncharacterized protein n=1 Tax=Symbiodinium natans TaxID=878477 RepID=A0A812RGB4_9DINO|nr:unnamed protein product [Symbiodinium natans]
MENAARGGPGGELLTGAVAPLLDDMMGPSQRVYDAKVFLEPVTNWLRESTMSTEDQYLMGELGGEVNFACEPSQCFSVVCVAERISISIASCLYGASCREIPWESLRNTPWENLIRNPWPVFELVAKWGRAHRESAEKQASVTELCTEKSSSSLLNFDGKYFDDQISRLESSPSLRRKGSQLLAATLLEEANLVEWSYLQDFCGRLLWSTLIITLALARDGAALSVGYALRNLWLYVIHTSLETTFMDQEAPAGTDGLQPELPYMELLATGPWNVLQFLPVLVAEERVSTIGFEVIDSAEAWRKRPAC